MAETQSEIPRDEEAEQQAQRDAEAAESAPESSLSSTTGDLYNLIKSQAAERTKTLVDTAFKADWKLVKGKQGVLTSSMQTKDSPLVLIRGEVTVKNVTMQDMAEYFLDFMGTMHISDSMWIRSQGKVVEDFGDGKHHVYYGGFKLPRPFSYRDFVWAAYDDIFEDPEYGPLGVSLAWGIPHQSVPPAKGFVRGLIDVAGYMWKPAAEPGCITLLYVVRVDAKGWLPYWVQNLVAGDQALNVARVRDYFDAKAKA